MKSGYNIKISMKIGSGIGKKIYNSCVILQLGLLSFTYTNSALGAFATEATQMLNNVQLLLQNQKMMESIGVGNKQLSVIKDSLKRYAPGDLQSSDICQLIERLIQISSQGEALGYDSHSISQFDRSFSTRPKVSQKEYETNTHKWSHSEHDSIKNSLQTASIQAKEFKKESQVLKKLEMLSKNAQTSSQSLQVISYLLQEQITQMQKLRLAVLENLKTVSAHFAAQKAKEDYELSFTKKHFVKYKKSSNNFSSRGGKR